MNRKDNFMKYMAFCGGKNQRLYSMSQKIQ